MDRDELRDELSEIFEDMTVDDMEYAVEWLGEELNRCDVCGEPIHLEDGGQNRDTYELVDRSEDTVVLRMCGMCVEDIFEHGYSPDEVMDRNG